VGLSIQWCRMSSEGCCRYSQNYGEREKMTEPTQSAPRLEEHARTGLDGAVAQEG